MVKIHQTQRSGMLVIKIIKIKYNQQRHQYKIRKLKYTILYNPTEMYSIHNNIQFIQYFPFSVNVFVINSFLKSAFIFKHYHKNTYTHATVYTAGFYELSLFLLHTTILMKDIEHDAVSFAAAANISALL